MLWDNIKLYKGNFVHASKEKGSFSLPCLFSKYLNTLIFLLCLPHNILDNALYINSYIFLN